MDNQTVHLEISESDRFPGDFNVGAKPGYDPTTSEAACIACLMKILSSISEDDVGDEELRDELLHLKSECAATLKRAAEELVRHNVDGTDSKAEDARDRAYQFYGIYRDRRARALEIPFVVEECPADSSSNRLLKDISIRTRYVNIPSDKQTFKVEFDRTLAVVKTVLLDKRRHWLEELARKLHFRKSKSDSSHSLARLDNYMVALAGIAKVGLMNRDRTQTPFAALALAGFREEFVAREAGLVKNSYVRRLGIDALLAVIVCASLYGATFYGSAQPWGAAVRNFFLLWAGAAVGTWLSFSIRRVILGFADLAVLEEDRLNPGFRILFMIALTTVIGLLFWTEMISLTVGGFNSNFWSDGTAGAALLIGALCGIAERSLASAVARRAEDFASGVGQSAKVQR